MNKLKIFTVGFIRENPVFCLFLGTCATLTLTKTLNEAVGLGVVVSIVLVLSNIIISLTKKIVPEEIKIPVYAIIIATLAKSLDLLLQAYVPVLSSWLGLFVSLIVVGGIVMARAEFASKHSVVEATLDGLGMGVGYTFGLILMAIVRQFLSTGIINLTNPFTGNDIFKVGLPENVITEYTIPLLKEPAGAFLTFAVIAAVFALINQNKGREQ